EKGRGKKTKTEANGENGDEDNDEYRWWLEQNRDDSIKWTSLEHHGVLFPPEYEPHGVRMKYNGREIDLEPEAEEVASFFAALLHMDHAKNPVFQENFFRDFQEVLARCKKPTPIKEFAKCDFTPIHEYFERERERKKNLPKEERLALKAEKLAAEEKYSYCMLDGRREKVGNFRVEPPALFRGRGAHPKTGCLKKRVMPEQVTINIGKDATVPPPPAGHQWGGVIHDNTVTWLATWKENINGSVKYVFLAANSSLKGQSDFKKFEKARELKKHIHKIRADYTKDLKDRMMQVRQRATAMYLIDRFALRAGNEKGDDEADTVGCCTLRCEHITLVPPNRVVFDFLGKDSIRYYREVDVDVSVWKNMKIFKKEPKGPNDPLFDRLTTASLNKHLSSLMAGLTAKVFRTFNASLTFQQELGKTPSLATAAEKVLAYNRANREVAVLCNHQRSVPKQHENQMGRMQDKIKAIKYQRWHAKRELIQLTPRIKKTHPTLVEPESDLDDDWCREHETDLVRKEREKAETKITRENEKRLAAKEKPLSKQEESDIRDKADVLAARFKEERKSGKAEMRRNATVEKLEEAISKLTERIIAAKTQMIDRDENKTTSLGTSKINYLDPRITSAWCRKHGVPLEKMFNATLRDKFRWAMDVDGEWEF
ncbi:hypothetical protein THASP1DRAFT_7692, partial [Thamnocephalis sphaerospora]